MFKIFCYGTLQEPSVQLELIGRNVEGPIDSIENFVVVRDYVDVDDGIAYPRIIPYENGCVYGRVLSFYPEEVVVLDEYETDMYKREYITTKGGEVVQVYVPNSKVYS
jgi:gamma-glutamylcyclotransferase (GGCT)/AIG2-like uncharacterized protein YtfP